MRKSSAYIAAVALASFVSFGCGDSPTEVPVAELDASQAGDYHRRDNRTTGKIVFANNGDIFVMSADGTGLTQLTHDPAGGPPVVDDQPSWSRNGRQIVFVSDRRNPGRPGGFPPDGQGGPNLEVYIMKADGSHPRRVTTTDQQDLYPHMSPNGKQIAFTRGLEFINVPQNFVINVDGTGETNLTNNVPVNCFPPPSADCAFEAYPRWSPNGKQILFNRSNNPGDADIFVMNADGSGKTNLTNSPGVNDFFARWSPSGKRIAFSSGIPFGPDARPEDIYMMRFDGSGLRQVTASSDRDIAAAWSPDSRRIAFHRITEGSADIFAIRRGGTDERQMTTEGGLFPSWTIQRQGRNHRRRHR